VEEGNNENEGMGYFRYFMYCKLIKFRLLSWFQGYALSSTKYSGILTLVPGVFLIGRTFKSPELNAFPKLELLKTLLSFSRR
jgi:hypothetical protein